MNNVLIFIRGGGDLATGVAVRLFQAGFSVMILEVDHPTVIRLPVSFARAVYEGKAIVEEIEAVLIPSWEKAKETIKQGKIPVLVDPACYCIENISPAVLVDAILAKRNLGTRININTLFMLFKSFLFYEESQKYFSFSHNLLPGQYLRIWIRLIF